MSFSVINKSFSELIMLSSTLLVTDECNGYGSWSSCPVTCGGGTQSRIRCYTKPSPEFVYVRLR